jgi:hypothetical protein
MSATRSIGLLCVVLGLVALVGGGAFAIAGYNHHTDGGWFSSGSDHDSGMMNTGYFVGGLGLLVLVIGIVLMSVGRPSTA